MKGHGTVEYGFRSRHLRYSNKLKRAVKDRTRELEEAHEELIRKNGELSTLLNVSRSLLKSRDLNELLDKALQGAITLVPSEAGVLFLVNQEKSTIELASFHNIEALPVKALPQTSRQLHFAFDDFSLSIEDPWIKSLCNLATLSDLLNSNRYYSYENGISEEIGGILTVLLRGVDGVLGFIILINRSDGDFTDEDARFLFAFSNESAVTIENFRMHASLLEKEKEVQTQRRLAIIGEMAAQIAHEIRNPLQKILTGVEYLRDYCGPKDNSVIEVVSKGVASVNKIISKMVEYGRPSPLNLQNVDIQDMIEDVVSNVRSRLNSNNIIVTRDFPQKAKLAVDPPRFRQGIQNVIDNAIDAMPGGGKLNISMRYAAAEGKNTSKASYNPANQSTRLEIKISDTGTGIDKDSMEKLFSPFHTTKVSGSGLGMAMLKNIIDLHKGEVSVKSRVGHGTDVFIRLPVKVVS